MRIITIAVILFTALLLPRPAEAQISEACQTIAVGGVAAGAARFLSMTTPAGAFMGTVAMLGTGFAMDTPCDNVESIFDPPTEVAPFHQQYYYAVPSEIRSQIEVTYCLGYICPDPVTDNSRDDPVDEQIPAECQEQPADCAEELLRHRLGNSFTPRQFLDALTFISLSYDGGYWKTQEYGYLIGETTGGGSGPSNEIY